MAPPFALLLVGSSLTGVAQVLVWLGAVAIDYFGIYLTGSSGWRVASPGHFAERHGLIVIIALGESIVAIGVGVADLPISTPVLAATAAGVLVVAGLWRLYFRQISESAEHRLTELDGDDRTRLARDAYTFLHLPLVGGIVLTALGMKTVLHQVADGEHYDLSEPLHGVVAWALAGGVGIFLLAAAAILLRTGGRRSLVLIVGGLGCLCAGLVVVLIPALLALALLAAAVTAMVVLHSRRAAAAETGPT